MIIPRPIQFYSFYISKKHKYNLQIKYQIHILTRLFQLSNNYPFNLFSLRHDSENLGGGPDPPGSPPEYATGSA